MATRGAATLAIWQRPVIPPWESWLDALPGVRLPTARRDVRAGMARTAVLQACREAGHETRGTAVEALAADIAELTRQFCQLAGTTVADLRLDAIDHDACHRFHRDRVALRMIVTYRGPGTQLVPPQHAREALSLQADYEGPLHTLDRRGVALFRGTVDGSTGIVHRSPPIAGSDMTRLLLCLSVPFR